MRFALEIILISCAVLFEALQCMIYNFAVRVPLKRVCEPFSTLMALVLAKRIGGLVGTIAGLGLIGYAIWNAGVAW